MSTKIYNGYKLNLSWIELMPFLKKVQTDLQEIRENLALRKIAYKVAKEIDEHYLGNSEAKPIWLGTLTLDARDAAVKAQKSSSLLDGHDYSANVIVIPYQENFLALFYAHNKEYFEKWHSYPEVKDYHYQNSSDQPEELSEQEWEQRRVDWDFCLPGLAIPSENGLIFEFLDSEIWYSLTANSARVFSFMPSWEDRIVQAAEQTLRAQFESQWLQGKNLDKFQEYSQWSECDREFKAIKKTKEYEESLTQAKKEKSNILPKVIDAAFILQYNEQIKTPE